MSFLSRVLANYLRPTNASKVSTAGTICKQFGGPTLMDNLKSLETSHIYQSVRTKIRVYFPRPSERKRVKRHGWEKRMSTPEGRRTIMRRILKGRFVLTH